ncbi:hypothetical protein D3C83_320170 [compost metagenome]
MSVMASCTSELSSIPIDASMLSGLTKSGMRRFPPVSKSAFCEKTANFGYMMPSKASIFFVSVLSRVM